MDLEDEGGEVVGWVEEDASLRCSGTSTPFMTSTTTRFRAVDEFEVRVGKHEKEDERSVGNGKRKMVDERSVDKGKGKIDDEHSSGKRKYNRKRKNPKVDEIFEDSDSQEITDAEDSSDNEDFVEDISSNYSISF